MAGFRAAISKNKAARASTSLQWIDDFFMSMPGQANLAFSSHFLSFFFSKHHFLSWS
jgi:hypothetical protein